MCEISPTQITDSGVQVPDTYDDVVDWGFTFDLAAYRIAIDPTDSNKQWVAHSNGLLGYLTDDTSEFTAIARFDHPLAGQLRVSDLTTDDEFIYVALTPTIYSESMVFKLPLTKTTFSAYTSSSPEKIYTGDVIRMCRTSDGLYWIRLAMLVPDRQDARDNGGFLFYLCHFNTSTEIETVLVEGVIDDPNPFTGWYAPFSLVEGPDGLIWVLKTNGKYFISGYDSEGSLPLASGGPPVLKTITRYASNGILEDALVMSEQDSYLGVDLAVCGSSVQVGFTSYEGET